jgi:phosphate starvation-inducible protein PhoH and related proteins
LKLVKVWVFCLATLKDKIDPYLRPLYDALFDILGYDKFQKYMERGLIEVAPLAYMRGRTLDHAFVILDEAQNTTREQMKMFLTRLGIGSRAVVTGDITQIDLPRGKSSGLLEALEVIGHIPEIGIVYLNEKDVVRHNLVQKIIKAYEAKDMLKSSVKNQEG